MWISCLFPTGGNFKYTIRRYETKLEFALSNDDDESREQIKIFKQWIKRNTTTYGELFLRLEQICITCKSGRELITKMK